VLRDDIVAPVAKIRTEDVGFAQLTKELQVAWEEAAPLVRDNINAPRVGSFLLRLQAYCEGRGWIQMGDFTQTMRLARPINIHAQLTLDRMARKCAKQAKRLEQLSIEQRHDLRKDLKKLRYASDFFLCLYPKKKSDRFVKALKKLQNIFGYLNDVAMAEELVAQHGHKSPEISMALGYLLGWHHGEAEKAFGHARVAWNDFAATKAFWR
jgi:CHAD domain-containing protein